VCTGIINCVLSDTSYEQGAEKKWNDIKGKTTSTKWQGCVRKNEKEISQKSSESRFICCPCCVLLNGAPEE